MSAIEQAEQYLLPFEDTPESEVLREEKSKARDGGVWFEQFVLAYIRLDGNGTQAVHAADEAVGRKRRSDTAAGKCATKYVKQPEIKQAIQVKREKAARAAGIELREFHAGVRLLHRQASGLIPVRKTLVAAYKGDIETEDADVYDTNLAAAGKALEMMGKSLGVFTDNLHVSGGLSHEEALDELDE